MSLLNDSARKASTNESLLKLTLMAFIVTAFGFAESGLLPLFTILLVTVLFICKYMDRTLFTFKKFPIELKLLNLWMLFAFFTGFFIAVNQAYFLEGMSKVFFYIMIANIIGAILLYRSDLINTIMFGIVFAGIVNLISVYLGVGADYTESTGRAIGLNSNPNSLGLRMVYASAALLFFLVIRKANFIYTIASLLLFAGFFQILLLSGSRKSLLAFVILFLGVSALYFTRNYKKIKLSTTIYSLLFLSLIAMAIYFVSPIFLADTVVGDRIEMGNERGGAEGDIRYEMYLYAFELFENNPVVGVGMNNFRHYFWSGQYSHSDYAESLSTTGLFGFLLYQSVYLIVLTRSIKLFFTVKDKILRLYAGMAFLFIIMLKVIGTGVILFYSPAPLIILAVFSVLTMQIRRDNISIA